jgi:hypothetical protein
MIISVFQTLILSRNNSPDSRMLSEPGRGTRNTKRPPEVTRYSDALPFLYNATVDKTPATIGAGNSYTTEPSTKPRQRKGSKHLHRNGTFGEAVFYSVLHVPTSGELVDRVSQRRIQLDRENTQRRERFERPV